MDSIELDKNNQNIFFKIQKITNEVLLSVQMDKTTENNVFVIENVLTPGEAKWIVERGEKLGINALVDNL